MQDDYSKVKAALPEGTPLAMLVDFSVPAAQYLSELSGLQADLESVEKICTRILAEHDTVVDAAAFLDRVVMLDALYAAAVVRFCRTQVTGSRFKIPSEWINEMSEPLQKYNAHLMSLRNKFIAHAVAPLEDNQIYVAVQINGPDAGRVKSVTVANGRYFGGDKNGAEALRKIAVTLKIRLMKEIAAEEVKLIEIAQALPDGELLARGYREFPIPSTNDVNKRRTPFTD